MVKRRNMIYGMAFSAVCAMGLSAQAQDAYIWNFNEGQGLTVADESGQFKANLGFKGPESQATSPSGQANDRSIIPNRGLTVDDSANPVLNLQQGPVTFEAWINPINLTGNQDIVRIGNSIKVGTSGANMLFTLLGIVDVNSNVGIPTDDAWHHVAYVWDPGVDVTFYLDGAEVAVLAETRGARNYQNTLMSIGADHAGGSNLQAGLDRLRIHNAVLAPSDLDSNAASPKAPLASTVVAYNFDETQFPFQNSTAASRPATSLAASTIPAFSTDTPAGQAGDFSLSFDGNDRVYYDDNVNFLLDFIDEPFTFQSWVKFDSTKQIAGRPIMFAYGLGGAGGYSFSFRPAPAAKAASVADSPSGAAGDMSVRTNSGLVAYEVQNDPFASLADGPVTFEAWIKPTALNGYTDIIRFGNSLKVGFNGDDPLFTLLGVADVQAADVVWSPTDTWHHIAYAWERGVGTTFFLNGQEVAFVPQTGAPRDFNPNQISIGAAYDGTSLFNGQIDRLRVHKALLTADQLDSVANAPKAALPETLVSYNFNEATPPYANAVSSTHKADNRGNLLTVTTFGIVDAHSNAKIPDDKQWHHIAAVFDWDGMAFRYYVDGQLSDVYAYSQGIKPVPANEAFLYMGSEKGGNYYVGNMDRVRITRGVLTPDQLDYFQPTDVAEWSLY